MNLPGPQAARAGDPREVRGWEPWRTGGQEEDAASAFSRAGAGRPRPGWYAWHPAAGAELPAFAVEVALTIECPSPGAADGCPEAVLLCRAPSTVPCWLDAVATGAREVEVLAGVRPPAELGLGPPLPLPGLDPISPPALTRQFRAAVRRGLVPLWPPESAGARATGVWQEGPGAVLHCWDGTEPSAQAVVVLHGQGDPDLLAPLPGGAVIVRAWRVGRIWGLVCAVVLGAAGALDLGREAARLSAAAGAAGWQASVPRCADAVAVARAGDPRQPIPLNAARRATQDELAALLASCLKSGMMPAGAPGPGPGAPDPGQAPVPASPARRREHLARLREDLDELPGTATSDPLAG